MDKKNIESIFPLTSIQKGLLFHALKDGEAGGYTGRHCLYLKGNIDVDAFKKSIDRLNQKYDIFRTRIVYSTLENPVQVVLKESDTDFFYCEDKSEEEFLEEDGKRGFHFEKENLIRVALVKIADKEYCNIWSFHHILIDGYSIAILAKDFFQIYDTISKGQMPETVPAPSYRRFVSWLEKQDIEPARKYWEDYISGEEQPCGLPGDLPGEGFEIAETSFGIRQNLLEKIKEYARARAVTVNSVFQGAWGILLSAYNRRSSILFGNVMAVRPPQMKDADKIAGMFSGTYPVRIKAGEGDVFSDIVKRANEDFLNGMKYAICSVSDLSGCARRIKSLYIFENFDLEVLFDSAKKAGVEITGMKMYNHSSYDFSISLADNQGEFRVVFRYNARKYSRECMEKVEADLLSVLRKITEEKEVTAGDLKKDTGYVPVLQNQVRKETSDTERIAETKTERTISKIFEEILNIKEPRVREDFFELGGDSIKGMRFVALCRKEGMDINLKELFSSPTIEELARIAETKGGARREAAVRYEPDMENVYEPFPLNDIQTAYLMGLNGEFEIGGFTTQYYTEIEGSYDIKKLEAALQKVVEHQPALRTVIKDYTAQQILEDLPPYTIEIIDIPEEKNRKRALAEHREKMRTSVFDRTRMPYFTIKAFKLGEDAYRICFLIECLCVDGAGLMMMLSELMGYYDHPEEESSRIAFTFRDYQSALAEERKKEKYTRDRDYWMAKVDTLPLAPEVALKGNPANIKNPRFLRQEHFFGKEEYETLQSFCRKNKITMAALLCAAYTQTLAFWSGSQEFSVSMTVFERNLYHEDVPKLIGDFTKLIVVDTQTEHEDLISQTKVMGGKIAEALEHSDYNCVNLIKEIALKRRLGTKAVLPYVFTCALSEHGAGQINQVYGISRTPQVYLDCQVTNRNGGLFVNWDYPEGLYDERMLEKMFRQYIRLIAQAGVNPTASVDEETERFIETYNHTFMREEERAKRHSQTLCDLFAPSFETYARRIAVKDFEKEWDYRTLGQAVYRICAKLKKDGVKPGDCVGITGERKAETVAAILAVLLCGAAYVPINEEYPRDRVAYIMKKTDGKVKTDAAYVREAMAKEPGNVFESQAKPDELAYIIFTSGTTGKPKGVAIDHKSALNTILDINERCGINEKDVFLCLAEFGFDLSVYDLFGALAAGSKLCIVRDQRNPEEIRKTIEENGVTFWNSVPAVMQMVTGVVEDGFVNKTIKNVYLSGDWIPVNLPDKIRNHFVNARVTSLGGATEASIWSIYYPTERKADISSVPYGMPLKNQTIHILNKWRKACPIGVRGEIYIGGDGVAACYYGDKEKTDASFVEHPQYGRLYKTGDYGKLREEGFVEFLGRIDSQVKIRGYRIELGEIESCALEAEGVQRAVAVTKNTGGSEGIALYVQCGDSFNETEVRSLLQKQLPDYMLPSVIEKMDRFPVTANGKIDRNKLKNRQSQGVQPARTEPANKAERDIGRMLSQTSGIRQVDYEKSFFEMGIDSLKAVVILNNLKKAGYDISLTDLYSGGSIAGIARALYQKEETTGHSEFDDGEL